MTPTTSIPRSEGSQLSNPPGFTTMTGRWWKGGSRWRWTGRWRRREEETDYEEEEEDN